jgi:hypothetical protein
MIGLVEVLFRIEHGEPPANRYGVFGKCYNLIGHF